MNDIMKNYLEYRIITAKYLFKRFMDRCIRHIVWNLPRSIVYWSFIRVMSHATTGKFSNTDVMSLTALEVMKRWDDGN